MSATEGTPRGSLSPTSTPAAKARKRNAGDTPGGGKRATVATPSKTSAPRAEDPKINTCERCSLYYGTDKWKACDGHFVAGHVKKCKRCTKGHKTCIALAREVAPYFNKAHDIISTHDQRMRDAGDSPENRAAEQEKTDQAAEKWADDLKTFQRNRNKTVGDQDVTQAGRKPVAGGSVASGGGSVALLREQQRTRQVLTGLWELGRAYVDNPADPDLSRADAAMAGVRARFEDEVDEEVESEDGSEPEADGTN